MCFSANVSFSASGILTIVGMYLLKKTSHLRLLPLSLIPIFFAIQQASEGFVWLTLPKESFFKYVFLFFAYVFWPIWVPFAVWFAEKNPKHKHLLALFLGMGIVTGCTLMPFIFFSKTLVHRSSLNYIHSGLPSLPALNIFYVLCSCLSLFLSSIKKLWIVGLLALIVGACIVWIDRAWAISMWCFFAALISTSLLWILPQKPSTG